jgi:SAM-dependent methyltransferase
MKLRDKYALLNKGVIGKLIYLRHPGDALLNQMRKFKLNRDSKILDVGCGNGAFLHRLKEAGFSDLTGIDLYIKNEIQCDDKLEILKTNLHSISGRWDLILFIHSFEHMSDPLDVFQAIYNNLSDSGFCVIVIPTSSSYAWEHYVTDWVQLDAPRHFFLHSIKSIKVIAEKAKLDLVEINYVSDELQFWGSEQYINGIPLLSEKSFEINPQESIFTFKQIAKFKQDARDLNASEKGDTAMFVLRKCACNQVGRP